MQKIINETPEEWFKRISKKLKKTKEERQKKHGRHGTPIKSHLRNITINIPDIYDANLLKLQKLGMIPSRSEGVRLAIRQFLQNEYKILKILGWYED